MDVLKLFEDHYFPTLWIIAQCEAARQVGEVGCERFFGLSGAFGALVLASGPRVSCPIIFDLDFLCFVAFLDGWFTFKPRAAGW